MHQKRTGKRTVLILVMISTLAIFSYLLGGLYGVAALILVVVIVYVLFALVDATGSFRRSVGLLTKPHMPSPGVAVGIIVLSAWGYWFAGVAGPVAVLVAAVVWSLWIIGFKPTGFGGLALIALSATLLALVAQTNALLEAALPDAWTYLLMLFALAGAACEASFLVAISMKDDDQDFLAFGSFIWSHVAGIGILLMAIAIAHGSKLFGVLFVAAALAGYYTSFWITWRVYILLRRQFGLLGEIAKQLRQLTLALAAACSGFLLITFSFGGFYAALFRSAPASFTGLPVRPTFFDFWYFSVVTCGTLGGDVVPHTRLAKLLTGLELIVGLGWVAVVFGAVSVAIREPDSKRVLPTQYPETTIGEGA